MHIYAEPELLVDGNDQLVKSYLNRIFFVGVFYFYTLISRHCYFLLSEMFKDSLCRGNGLDLIERGLSFADMH